MALHTPVEMPPTWQEFEARCRERIRKIRESGDQGHFANTYAEDVEMLLAVMRDSHLDYHGSPTCSYRFVMEHLDLLRKP